MNPDNKIEEKVMEEIKSGKVKLRSRYIFLAEKLGLSGAFAFSVLLAVLFFTLALFYLKTSDNLGYLSFGSRGMFAFLETFPYLLVATLILSIFIAGFILKKSGVLYQKPFSRLALGLLGFIVLAGVVLTFTSLGERIEKRSYESKASFFHQCLGGCHRGLAGRIIELGDGVAVVQTPMGTKKINLTKLSASSTPVFEIGMFIVAVGNNEDEVFFATDIRIINEDEMPMIRRGVDDRFGSFEGKEMPLPDRENPPCFEGCNMNKIGTSSCEENCLMK